MAATLASKNGGARMKVRDAMSKDVVTVREDAPYHEVAETMLLHGVGGLPVVDANGSLRGIITEADLLPKEAEGFLSGALQR